MNHTAPAKISFPKVCLLYFIGYDNIVLNKVIAGISVPGLTLTYCMCCSSVLTFPVKQGTITDVARPFTFGFTSKLGGLDNLAKVLAFNNVLQH